MFSMVILARATTQRILPGASMKQQPTGLQSA